MNNDALSEVHYCKEPAQYKFKSNTFNKFWLSYHNVSITKFDSMCYLQCDFNVVT